MLVRPTADATATEQRISRNPTVCEAAGAFFPPNPLAGNGTHITATYNYEHSSIPRIARVMATATA